MLRIATSLLGLFPLCATASALSSSGAQPSLIVAARDSLLAGIRQMRPDLTRVDVSLLGHPAAPALAGAELLAVFPAHRLSARECVWVSVSRGGKSIASVPVWFSVRAMSLVLVTERAHGAHETVSRTEVSMEERDVAGLLDQPVDRETDLSLLRTRHAIAAGRVLLHRDLEERPPVLAGDDVDVAVKHRSIAIETRAVALREARLGESVELKNPDSAQTYRARVTGPGRAEVSDP
jgi:flagella basal body P-ring formation protein FlgA